MEAPVPPAPVPTQTPGASLVPRSLRLAALVCAGWGVFLLRPGPKLGIAVVPAALFLAAAWGLYRGRRDGGLAALFVTLPWFVLEVMDFLPPRDVGGVLVSAVVFGSLAYVVAAVLFKWRALRRASRSGAAA